MAGIVAQFENEFGEPFMLEVGFPGIVMMMSSETDWKIISLFNTDFSIYSDEELVLLGKALIELGEQKQHGNT